MSPSVPIHVIIRTTIQRSEPGHVNIHQWQNPSTHLSIHAHLIISLISIHLHLILSKSSETKDHHLKQHAIIWSKTREHNVPCISSNTTPCETTLPHTFALALTVNHLFGHIICHICSQSFLHNQSLFIYHITAKNGKVSFRHHHASALAGPLCLSLPAPWL